MGVSKTVIGRRTGITHSYTLETGYFWTNKNPRKYIDQSKKKYKGRVIGISEYKELGSSFMVSLADFYEIENSVSKISKTKFKNVKKIRDHYLKWAVSKAKELYGDNFKEMDQVGVENKNLTDIQMIKKKELIRKRIEKSSEEEESDISE